jgi:hypothetical protein
LGYRDSDSKKKKKTKTKVGMEAWLKQ